MTYFVKTFEEFRQGFDLNCELWLGLEKMHQLTATGKWELIIDGISWKEGEHFTARYGRFSVGPGPR